MIKIKQTANLPNAITWDSASGDAPQNADQSTYLSRDPQPQLVCHDTESRSG